MFDSPAIDKNNDVVSFERILERYNDVRQASDELIKPLSEADAQLQSMPDTSPSKWHLAHTTWFFETFILCHYMVGYSRVDESYNYLFNSYYNGIGEQYPRAQRGLISRPSLTEIMVYRHTIDAHMQTLIQSLGSLSNRAQTSLLGLIELGCQHEQQHQELFLTDIKHCLAQNPQYPVYQHITNERYRAVRLEIQTVARALEWVSFPASLTMIGHDAVNDQIDGEAGVEKNDDYEESFSFDNERPAHSTYIHAFSLASRLVSNQEYGAFIDAGGYDNPDYWLADGWAWRQQNAITHPVYWHRRDGEWFEFTLNGLLPLNQSQAVIHINYYEASAYANWLGVRLPTEFEWEYAIRQQQITPNVQSPCVHPYHNTTSIENRDTLEQAFGQAWQWTTSSYSAYPGFVPFSGVAGEYNGKFMSNQYVLRGSSCATSKNHARVSYRNFFYAHQNWQFTGIRLAK